MGCLGTTSCCSSIFSNRQAVSHQCIERGVRQVIQSMPQRMGSCIALLGGHIPYIEEILRCIKCLSLTDISLDCLSWIIYILCIVCFWVNMYLFLKQPVSTHSVVLLAIKLCIMSHILLSPIYPTWQETVPAMSFKHGHLFTVLWFCSPRTTE